MHLSERLLLRLSHAPRDTRAAAASSEWSPETALALYRRVCPSLLEEVRGNRVLEHGCGTGEQVIALAEAGAREVVGVDLSERWLSVARARAAARGSTNVRFNTRLEAGEQFDVVVSRNAMEHYPHPAAVLNDMLGVLKPGGALYITFGPLWFAPYGAHMNFWTPLPWVHLLFPEATVMRVRARVTGREDGAARYEEVEGGLNRMTVRKFKRLIRDAGPGIRVEQFRPEYVRGQAMLGRLPILDELLTNHLTCVLRKQ